MLHTLTRKLLEKGAAGPIQHYFSADWIDWGRHVFWGLQGADCVWELLPRRRIYGGYGYGCPYFESKGEVRVKLSLIYSVFMSEVIL